LVTYWVLPGNKKPGYWRVNVKAFISLDVSELPGILDKYLSNSRYKEALNWAIPPRKG
jgi:hypothetical protein